MTDPTWRDGEVSIFALGTMVLRNRWRIIRWSLAGGLLALIIALFTAPEYNASASFMPQGTDISRSGLASLAGQFGLSLPTGSQSLSPDFYAQLLKSRTILLPIAQDTFAVSEMGGKKVSFETLFKIKGSSPSERGERAVQKLEKIVGTSVGQKTGVVGLSVSTKWPSVSLGIIQRLVTAVDDFNLRTRQGQAAAERKFVEGRLAVAASDLRAAEDRLQSFLQQNREFLRSPELKFDHDRLQRDLDLQQQVYSSLTQSHEEVRIREIRDTPVITIVEPPSVQTLPESRQRALRVLLGFIFGAFLGAMVAFASEAMRRRRQDGDVQAEQFAESLGEVKGAMLAPVRTLRQRIRR
jgi:uncharacterized protein involved in exopolysaccharide biosynthesis